MAKIVCSGGPLGGEIVDAPVKPGETFDVDGARYRRDVGDLELAVYVGSTAPPAPQPSRLAAALAAKGGA